MTHPGFASRTPRSAPAKAVLIIGVLVFVPYLTLLFATPAADQWPSIVRTPLSTMGLWLFLLSWLVLGRVTGYLLFTFGLLVLLAWSFTDSLNWRQKIMLGVVGVALISFVFSPYRPAVSPTGDEQMLILTEPPPWLRGLRNAQVFGEMTPCQYTILGWSGSTLLYRAECSGKHPQIWQFTPDVSEEPTLYVENVPNTLHKQQLDRRILLSHLYAPGVYPPGEEYAVRSLFVPDAPLVSPDGDWVAFITRRPYSVQDVMVMHLPEDGRTGSSQ